MNIDEALPAGMYADVIIYSKGNVAALVVPKSAVVTSTERKYALVSKDGKILKTVVSNGNAGMDKIEIYGALKPVDTVIINANDEIKENKT
ncbi:MAG: hypothetical protein ABI707_01945 [Ferruginibacter sp.]